MNKGTKFLKLLYNIMPILIILIFIDRMLFINLLLPLKPLFSLDWINSTIEVHIVMLTISDFLGSCIQLYLTYKFSSAQHNSDGAIFYIDEVSSNHEQVQSEIGSSKY